VPRSEAIQAIEKVGGRIARDDKDASKPVVSVTFPERKGDVAPALPHLKAFPKLRVVIFPYVPSLDDKGAEHLANLKGLKVLSLVGTSLTEKGMKHLAGLTNLESLELASTPVTDAGLKHLHGLKRLQVICLADTKVTDRGKKALQDAIPGLVLID
jgi:hypothetical protein